MAPFRSMADRSSCRWAAVIVATCTGLGLTLPAGAQDRDATIVPPPNGAIPLPAPFYGRNAGNPLVPPRPGQTANPAINGALAEPSVTISSDASALPAPVRRMRELIMEAARSGDPERLRPLIGSGADTTQLSLANTDRDPIEFFTSMSGDTKGHEMLAILLEVFEAGYARYDAGQPTELFVWPYFFAKPLKDLNPQQRVELFKLVTAGDYDEMASFGAYIFFRAGITPQGRWLFFITGD